MKIIPAFVLLALASVLWFGADLGNEKDFVERGHLGPEFRSFIDRDQLQNGVLSFKFFKKQYSIILFNKSK